MQILSNKTLKGIKIKTKLVYKVKFIAIQKRQICKLILHIYAISIKVLLINITLQDIRLNLNLKDSKKEIII